MAGAGAMKIEDVAIQFQLNGRSHTAKVTSSETHIAEWVEGAEKAVKAAHPRPLTVGLDVHFTAKISTISLCVQAEIAWSSRSAKQSQRPSSSFSKTPTCNAFNSNTVPAKPRRRSSNAEVQGWPRASALRFLMIPQKARCGKKRRQVASGWTLSPS